MTVNLFKIQHELIAGRSADAWYKLPSNGPTFRYRWAYGRGQDDGYSYVSGEHHSHAVCREEPSLTVSWGLKVYTDEDREDGHYEWASNFVNTSVRLQWADFYWNNALVDRVELAVVDGGHGLIPFPDYGLKVSEFEVSVAALLQDLDDSGEPHPAHYLGIIGAEIVRDQDRWGAGSP